MTLLIYFFALTFYLYSFLFQRTTLKIARIIERYPIPDVQLALTPKYMGLMGWIGSIGVYGSLLLVWLELGFIYAIAGLILNFVIPAVIPIPHVHFFTKIESYLENEIKQNKGEKRELLEALRETVAKIRKEKLSN